MQLPERQITMYIGTYVLFRYTEYSMYLNALTSISVSGSEIPRIREDHYAEAYLSRTHDELFSARGAVCLCCVRLCANMTDT